MLTFTLVSFAYDTCRCVCVCVCVCVSCTTCARYDNPLGRTISLFFTFSKQENTRKINVDNMIKEYNQLHDDEAGGACLAPTQSSYAIRVVVA
jgi:hypothetical protein